MLRMTIRERLEEREHQMLSDWATFSDASRGREHEITPCDNRTCFERDRDRITHSKAFRRLSNKTQVFISPEGDHYRTRLTHTIEVSQIARTIGRALGLNEDLIEAIALGHDLGHAPLGHAGEAALDEACSEGFRHNEQSLRVVDKLENLNLTWEVRNGIVCHTGSANAATPEGKVIHYCDRIAYINHDIDDAIRAGIISNDAIPLPLLNALGRTHGERIDTMVEAMIAYGEREHEIGMYAEVEEPMLALRQFMFDHVYRGRAATEEARARSMLHALYDYFYEHHDEMPADYMAMILSGESPARVVCDYISSMTDRYSITTYKNLSIPRTWDK